MTDNQTNESQINNPTHQLLRAIHEYDSEGVKKSINDGADVNQSDPLDIYGWGSSPLHFACGSSNKKESSFKIIEALLLAGADPNMRRNNFSGETPLHYNASVNRPDILRLLVKHGADINSISNQGKTPMSIALENFRVDQVALLQEMGISINTPIGEFSSGLHTAIRMKRCDIMEAYLQMGADPNFTPSGRESPLMACVKENLVEMIQILLAAGADINGVNSKGNTFLHSAAHELYSRANLIPIALQAGANPNLQNNDGATPLMVAVRRYNSAFIKTIIHHTDMRITDYNGNHIIHQVVKVQDINFIEFVFTESMGAISQNPNPEKYEMSLKEWRLFLNQANHQGYTPLQIAQSFENMEIREIVEQFLNFAQTFFFELDPIKE